MTSIKSVIISTVTFIAPIFVVLLFAKIAQVLLLFGRIRNSPYFVSKYPLLRLVIPPSGITAKKIAIFFGVGIIGFLLMYYMLAI